VLQALFAAFEIAHLCERLPSLTPEEVLNPPNALRQLIATTLDYQIRFPVVN